MPETPEDAEQQAGSEGRLASLQWWEGESSPAELFRLIQKGKLHVHQLCALLPQVSLERLIVGD